MLQTFSTSQAAEILGVSIHTLISWRANGKGPPFIRLGPKLIRYRSEDLAAWLADLADDSQKAVPGDGHEQ